MKSKVGCTCSSVCVCVSLATKFQAQNLGCTLNMGVSYMGDYGNLPMDRGGLVLSTIMT